jgi:pyruvate kinase
VNKKSKKILCTLGPSSFDSQIMKRLEGLGTNLFRINLSHTKLADLPNLIKHIQSHSNVPICIDTEGAQIRTGDFIAPHILVQENSLVKIVRKTVPGNTVCFNITPSEVLEKIQEGDFVSIDFNSVLGQVISKDGEDLVMRVLNGGKIGRNKAITIECDIELPPLTNKDIMSIKIGRELGLTHFALSFANRSSDVELLRTLVTPGSKIISKIESISGLNNLQDISRQSDALLIDRGDLSRQVSLEQIPRIQKSIITTGKACGREVFVATNLLESMVSNIEPTRAEVNDIYNTMLDGADGLVLAAETAIGKYPVECVSMVLKVMQHFDSSSGISDSLSLMETNSLLVAPHGGQLITQYASSKEKKEASSLHQIEISENALLDCEQIAHGTYSPLKGFMDSLTVNSVLDNYSLLDGNIWTMPILLPIDKKVAQNNKVGTKITLKGKDGILYATLDISEIFQLDLDDLAMRWFMTKSKEHPGVAKLYCDGNFFLAGEIKLLERQKSALRYYEYTPTETRFIFSRKGWSQVIGFHTRNPIHRGHEYIQKKALEISGADGLYINPVGGPKKYGDFKYEYIMQSYQTMLDFGLYPEKQVLLGSFITYSRYGGPREAVFTALCRKNMGCSHFIIGRDHTGVGLFYKENSVSDLFKKIGDIDIKILFFPKIGFNKSSGFYEEMHDENKVCSIEGTNIRDALRLGEKVDDWLMRDLVQDSLLDLAVEGDTMFVEKDPVENI